MKIALLLGNPNRGTPTTTEHSAHPRRAYEWGRGLVL